MDQNFDIQAYLTRGVERVVSDAIRATVKNPKESAFMLRFAAASKAVIFVEFVPVTEESRELAPGGEKSSGGLLVDDHRGGCVLYEKREQVRSLLA